jgi:hypothetical protein
MIKNIKVGNKEIQLDNNVGWAMEYKDQFGSDIIPAIMPIFASALDIIAELVNRTGKTKEITISDILSLTDGDALINAMVHLGGLEFVDFLNITWALAKNADNDIPDPKTWAKQFDTCFPVDEIAPEVVKLIFKGMVSSKNQRKLNSLIKAFQQEKTKKSHSTISSSPDSSEG